MRKRAAGNLGASAAKAFVAAVTPSQYQWLESLGCQLQIEADKTAALGTQATLDYRFHYLSQAHNY